MAKNNPAVNFYTSDFLTGTTFLTNRAVGGYIRLLSYQHQLGHLNLEKINQILFDLDDKERTSVLEKFTQDKEGNFFNKRMEKETIKKKNYSENRAKNRKGKVKISKTYEEDMKNICISKFDDNDNKFKLHMENENEIENINNYINYYINNINSNITNTEYEYLISFENVFKENTNDIVKYAIDICVMNKVFRMNYLRAILNNWQKAKLLDLDSIKKAEKEKISETSIRNNSSQEDEVLNYNWLEDENLEEMKG